MKTCIVFFIVFELTQQVQSVDYINATDDVFNSPAPYPIDRPKRAPQQDYRHWTTRPETSSIFLVDVPEESDYTSPPKNRITNIAVIRKTDRIIHGGAMANPVRTTTAMGPITPDYTRFGPPSDFASRDVTDVTKAIAPPLEDVQAITPPERTTMKPMALYPERIRHPHRDESPPSGPQFLPKSGRTYGALTPVAFNLKDKNIVSPALTPPPHRIPLMETKDLQDLPEDSEIEDFSTTTEKIETDEIHEIHRAAILKQFVLDDVINADDASRTPPPDGTTPYRTTIYQKDLNSQLFENMNEVVYDSKSKSNTNPDVSNIPEKKYENTITDPLLTHESITKQKDFIDTYDELREEVRSKSFDKFGEYLRHNYSNIDDYSDYADKTTFEQFFPETNTSKVDLKSFLSKDDEPIDLHFRRRASSCQIRKTSPFDSAKHSSLAEIVHKLKYWAENSPMVDIFDITYGNLTYMENPIYAMLIDDPSRGQVVSAKRSVMVVGGIQGRDHYAVAAAMHILHQLIEKSDDHGELLSQFRFTIIPVFNPDGYDYTVTFPHHREWKKNLHQSWSGCHRKESCSLCRSYGINCIPKSCFGVHLDRNFEYQWLSSNELSAEHPCSDLYSGHRQLSEPETRGLIRYLHELKTPLYYFIALKEGDVLGIMYPYSHTKRRRAHDQSFRQRADRAATAANSINDRTYVFGQTSEFLQLYAGGIEDWVDSHLGVDYTFTIMLHRPRDKIYAKLKSEYVSYEAYAAMNSLLLSNIKEAKTPPVNPTNQKHTARRHIPPARHSNSYRIQSTKVLPTVLSLFTLPLAMKLRLINDS